MAALTTDEVAVVRDAVAYVLRRACTDRDFARHFGPYTESWARLTAAYAVLEGRDVEDVRAECWRAQKALAAERRSRGGDRGVR